MIRGILLGGLAGVLCYVIVYGILGALDPGMKAGGLLEFIGAGMLVGAGRVVWEYLRPRG